jgi:Protein of unknown function (DUF2480)
MAGRISFVTLPFSSNSIMADELINKVALSPLVTLDLATFYPQEQLVLFDIKPFLFMELIVKEKDFREALKSMDWSVYQNKLVTVYCSTDAVIPVWAYMLVASYLQPVAAEVFFGDEQTALRQLVVNRLQAIEPDEYKGKRVVVKGCGDLPIGEFAYFEITKRLLPVVKSIMYGEACSTVPIFKAK